MSIATLVATTPLRRGMKNGSVQRLQQALRALGHSIAADGDFGALTEAAVKRFQASNDLLADGVVGKLTAAVLDRRPKGEPVPSPAPVPAPPAPTSKIIWPPQSGVPKYYGAVGQNQTMLSLPYPMKIAWDTKQIITRFSVHQKVHDSAARCFARIADAYDAAKRAEIGIDLFGGCLNVRPIRGGSEYSMHSWGIAIDFDPERNQLQWGRERARLAKSDCETFWRIWEDEGWLSLGRSRNFDWMHVQAARL